MKTKVWVVLNEVNKASLLAIPSRENQAFQTDSKDPLKQHLHPTLLWSVVLPLSQLSQLSAGNQQQVPIHQTPWAGASDFWMCKQVLVAFLSRHCSAQASVCACKHLGVQRMHILCEARGSQEPGTLRHWRWPGWCLDPAFL